MIGRLRKQRRLAAAIEQGVGIMVHLALKPEELNTSLLRTVPRATHDAQAGATYVYLTDRPVARTMPLSDSVNVDLDADGSPCGVEVLHGERA